MTHASSQRFQWSLVEEYSAPEAAKWIHTLQAGTDHRCYESGSNVLVAQNLLAHAGVKTTEIYPHVLQQNLAAVVRPLDQLPDQSGAS